MSGQRKKDLAKESKKHRSIGKKDKQGGLVMEIQGRKSFHNESDECYRGQLIRDGRVALAIRSHWCLK